MTIQEKLEKEQNKLNGLLEQKKELDKKIQKAQDNVEKYDSMIKQKVYEKTDEIFSDNISFHSCLFADDRLQRR